MSLSILLQEDDKGGENDDDSVVKHNTELLTVSLLRSMIRKVLIVISGNQLTEGGFCRQDSMCVLRSRYVQG